MTNIEQWEIDLFLCELEAYEQDIRLYAKRNNININKIDRLYRKEVNNELPY
jgi:hypothetical protein